MIDYGLLVSMIVAFGAPSLLAWWWPIDPDPGTSADGAPASFLDVALAPAFAGLAVGRLITLALDDPNSIGSISDMLIIRSGVEFWPGVAAAAGVVLWAGRRVGMPAMHRLASVVPLAMVGYGSYEAACLLRDGCFGPESSVGLRPRGVSTTMFPVGVMMAIAIVVAAFVVRAISVRGRSAVVVALATVAVAGVRAVGSIWLPHVGAGLTRQHVTSIVVAVAGAAALAVALLGDRGDRPAARSARPAEGEPAPR